MPAKVKNNILHYEGSNYLRYRLLLSTLSGKPVRIEEIRTNEDDPGLRGYVYVYLLLLLLYKKQNRNFYVIVELLFFVVTEYEVNFIRLLDKITNGSRIELNETGTSLYYSPGLLSGGDLEHECSPQRGITYYLEVVMALAPFCKKPVNLTMRGVTNTSLGNNNFPCCYTVNSYSIVIN